VKGINTQQRQFPIWQWVSRSMPVEYFCELFSSVKVGSRVLVAIAIFLIAVSASNLLVYGAGPYITIYVNPPTPVAGSHIQFVGWIHPSLGSSTPLTVSLSQGAGCTGGLNILGTTDKTGSIYIFNVTLGVGYLAAFGPGIYSVKALLSNPQLSSACLEFRIYSTLPETMTLSVSPLNPTANGSIQFRGTISPSLGSTQTVGITVFQGPACGLYGIPGVQGVTDSTGSSYNVIETLGSGPLSRAGPGSYSVIADIENTQIVSTCTHFTVSSPVPEFGGGLWLVVVLVASGLITRRARRKKAD